MTADAGNQPSADDDSEKKDKTIRIVLDDEPRASELDHLNGRQIRELGPVERVDGFETQEVDEHGKKKRTIPDGEVIKLHEGERFRTVPSHGGPGAGA